MPHSLLICMSGCHVEVISSPVHAGVISDDGRQCTEGDAHHMSMKALLRIADRPEASYADLFIG
jgi:hypothetical protein